MTDLIFIFLGGILCGISIVLVLVPNERNKNANKQRSVRKTTK